MDRPERDVRVGASPSGLTEQVAERLLAEIGPNRLPRPPGHHVVVQLAGQFVHFFALMLWVAAGLAWLAGLPALTVAIAAVVVLNGVFAFVQEHRADRAADRLRDLLPVEVAVRRDGVVKRIIADRVVPGDVVVLATGDRLTADGVVTRSDGLRLDLSMLTGESESVPAEEGGRALAATFVVDGDGEMVVDATGGHTRLAGIAALSGGAARHDTPLTRELTRLVRTIAAIAVGIGAAFFLLVWFLGRPIDEGAVFAIGVTVALVPEALLPTVTLSLAWGAERMAERHVLVRRLDAVETLGSTTFVCTDKTGTLTRNEMTVVEAWTPVGTATATSGGYDPTTPMSLDGGSGTATAVRRLAIGALRCSTGSVGQEDGRWVPLGEPMDAAIDVLTRRLGLDPDADRVEFARSAHAAFDQRRRLAASVVDGRIVVKGAPESVLPRCAGRDPAVDVALDRLTRSGMRVLAVAERALDPGELVVAATSPGYTDGATDLAASLELLGLLAFHDPPRDGVAEAIADCRRAGVAVAMLTGDHPATAAAIAARIGLLGAEGTVLVGDALPEDDAVLGALLDRDGVVVARVAPEDKLRIARVLQERGHVVAMTGDGVNDAPALRQADIGVAMGASGTDVAREAADLVLLDDHFASIVAGIEQGRATYVNVRRFLTYHLTDNVAELTPFLVWALSGGQFPLALGVLQILALDLGTDTLSAVALGAEPAGRHTLDGPPVRGHLLDRTVARRAFGLLGPTIAAMTMLAFTLTLLAGGWRPGDGSPGTAVLAGASGAAFMTVVLGQTVNAFSCRSSTRTPRELGWTTNRLLVGAVVVELAFSLVVLLVGPIARELGHAAPPLIGWLVALTAMPVVWTVDVLDKRRRRS